MFNCQSFGQNAESQSTTAFFLNVIMSPILFFKV